MTAIRNNTSPSQNSEVTEESREKSRAEIQAWLASHRGLIDIFLDAYCIVDLSNNVVDFNTAFTELCGESYRKIMKTGNFCELIKTELCPGQCPAVQVMAAQKPLRLDELSGHSKAFPNLQLILGGIPMFNPQNEIIGALMTIRNVSAETELQKKYEERKQESLTDGLTRLYNKVFTESLLLRFIKTAAREPANLTVVMCDVDHFKKVNDGYGHQAGDHVLSEVADMMKGQSRETDVAGRFGGEEFIVILPKTDQNGAGIFAERFRKRIETAKVEFQGKHIPLTISIGTATFNETWLDNKTPEECMKLLVARADTALYYAKKHGRNQSCAFETLPADAAAPDKEKKKDDDHH